MTEYSQEELRRMIDAYSSRLMNTYGEHHVAPSPDLPPVPEEPNTPVISNDDVPIAHEAPQNELTDIGRLQIRVSTENEAIPLVGAVVTVTDADGALMQLLTTDESGLTAIIDLPTKDRELSLSPDNPSPYTVYTVNVTADGYFQKRFTDLPIYGGVTAIQNVSMIPLPEVGDNDIVLTYPQNGGPTML